MVKLKLISQALQYLDYRRIFVGHRDSMLYRRLRNQMEPAGEAKAIRVQAFGGRSVLVRPQTMDAVTLWDAVFNGFHLPPVPLDCRSIVELGANAGYTTAHYACKFPQAKILAVEMDSDNVKICEKNTEFARDRVTIISAAIWSSDGFIEYGGDNVHDLRICALGGESTETVASAAPTAVRKAPAITIGTLLNEHHIPHVDFMKMDIEGAEAAVLNADLSWLKKVQAILIEIHPPATREMCQSILKREGFRVSYFQFDHEALFGIR